MLRPDYIIYRYNRYKNFIIGLYTVGTCLTYWFKHIYDKKGATHRSSRKQIPTGRCNYVACNVQPIQDYECGLSYLLVVPYASLSVRSYRLYQPRRLDIYPAKIQPWKPHTETKTTSTRYVIPQCTLCCSAEDNSRYVSEVSYQVSYQWNLGRVVRSGVKITQG